MNPWVHQLQTWVLSLGIPAAFAPVVPFIMGIAILYIVIGSVIYFLRRFKTISSKTAAFYMFISPWALGFVIFLLGPMVYSLYLSFTNWSILSPPQWVGLQNYQAIFHDQYFFKALLVTVYYTFISVPLQVVLSFCVGLLMNSGVRGMHVFRTIYYLPTLVSGVAQTVFFIWFFNSDYGLLNGVLGYLGIKGPDWLLSPHWAMPAVIMMSAWTVGGNMIIYLAGLTDIPKSLYEAAEIDGAGVFQKFWRITTPQMTPILFFNLITGMIGAFQTFTQGALIGGGEGGGGGPNDSLLFYVYYIYETAFNWLKMGYGSALAWILFIIIMIFTFVVFRSSAVWVYYETDQYGGGRRRGKNRGA